MSRDVPLIQTWYPQIYLACHTRHASSAHRLSPRDSALAGLSLLARAARTISRDASVLDG
jgi:hypothetical protein